MRLDHLLSKESLIESSDCIFGRKLVNSQSITGYSVLFVSSRLTAG